MNPFPRLDINELSDNTQPIIYQITDWFIPETDKNKSDYESDDNYTIYIYGTTEDNITVCTKVLNFKPFFYVKPPTNWNDLKEKDLKAKVKDFKSKLLNDSYDSKFKGGKTFKKKIIGDDYQSHFHNIEIVSKKDFWGFTNNQNFNFLKIVVNSLFMYNNLKYYFQSDNVIKEGFKLYESNIDPFLRFIHMKEIKPCGWIQVTNYDYQDNIPDTKCNYNLSADWNDIQAMNINKIAPLIVASFDIECTSSHGDFPVAIKNYKKLAQDLCYLSKGGFDDANLINNIYNAFFNEVKIKDNYIINRLYSKIQVTDDLKKTLYENESTIRFILSKVKLVELPDDDNEDDNEDKPEVGSKKMTTKEYNEIEDSLNKLLSDVLPALEGDKIIQIGVTVNKFGSDEIIYKEMISLNDCDDIEGVNVKCCKTESELLLYWKRFMDKLNPDVIIGYNIWGFDIEYIWDRSKELGINGKFKMGLGRIRNRTCNLVEQKLSSSALGDNIFKIIETDGVVCIDLFKVIQKDFKLDSYKLDNVASIYIGENKDDLKPNEIFEKFKGNSADRCVIAKYCIQDCILVNKLLHKLKIIENNIGMGNVCLVPLNYLFRRGQGIKIFSLVANECMKKDYLIPVIKNFIIDDDTDGYEGAIVLDPKEGIYLDEPIVVFDYGSLYPSSMICRNLSHDTYIIDNKYKDIKDDNVEIIKVSYDLYEGIGDKKEKTGVKDCYFARYKDGRKGVIPDILEMLLNQRKNTRKKIEYKTVTIHDGREFCGSIQESDNEITVIDDEFKKKTIIPKKEIIDIKDTYNKFECAVFDALQNAYKVTANSLYGQIGARTSAIYLKDIAACTTSTGREMIMLAKKFVEDNYETNVIYGDSVMPYTPITYKLNDKINVSTFEKLEGEWFEYNNFKPFDSDRFNKEQFIPENMLVWTGGEWSKVKRIIRHKTIKKIYRILTHTGLVDVTEDHSLLNEKSEIIKPIDCIIGQELLHSKPDITVADITNIDEEQAYIYGVFVGDGSCGSYKFKDGIKYSWTINNKDISLLEKCKNILERIEGIPFKIINTIKSSNVYKLIPHSGGYNSIKNIVLKYREKCYLDKSKVVPNEILNSNSTILEKFRLGLHDTDGNRMEYNKYGNLRIDTKNQVTAQSYCLMFQLLGYKVSINTRSDKSNIYRLSYTFKSQKINPIAIKKIDLLYENYNGYVYDIETEKGVFHGGIGNIILKNTDSIFCKFKIRDESGMEITGKDALPYAIKIGQDVENKIKKFLPYPQKLNYEKSMFPFILFSKKRYVGNLYENDPNAKPKQKSMGIVLKRRDNANIVKKVFGGIIDIILNKQDLNLSIKFLRDELKDLVEGKTDMKDLILSKTLRGFYKDPTRIAHKVLADRIAVRDPGNKPAVNDRVQYIYIKNKEAKLQGDKIETPEFIIENNLQPDYLHYITNQIMKPILQLYVLCLQELDIYSQEPDYWMKIEEELKLKDMYKDDTRRKNRLENLKLLKVQELLFDEFISKLKEPKLVKVPKAKIKAIKNKTDKSDKTDKTETPESEPLGDILTGDIRITESKKTNMISYKVKIEKYLLNGEVPISETKEKVLKKLLSDIFDKYPTKIIEIKVNNKGFIKDYNYFKTRFNNLAQSTSMGISEIKEQNKIINNDIFIKIKDNIILKD